MTQSSQWKLADVVLLSDGSCAVKTRQVVTDTPDTESWVRLTVVGTAATSKETEAWVAGMGPVLLARGGQKI